MEQFSVGGIVVRDANIIHDSTKEVFRSPLGAVAAGTKVELTLKIEDIPVEQAVLCVLREGGIDRLALSHQGGMHRIRYKTPVIPSGGGCVLWYWFEITLEGGAVCYYGAGPSFASGLGQICLCPPPAFQLTVYDAGFKTPDWAKSAVLYQVFPDRFQKGDEKGVREGIAYHQRIGRPEMELQEDWGALPLYEAKDGQNYYMPSDIFGGDLEGIRQRLPYLQSLGVTLLYLNPIFEAASNHRYNTGDYQRIDPILGDEQAFHTLVEEAKAAGIRIILDGVFSHTGDDSIYFNKYGRYHAVGAFQSADSPYAGWYRFTEHPNRYKSWWGFESLPEVNELDPGWQEFMVTGPKSVVKRWIEKGASGYRLDVADELPDKTIEQIRTAVKAANPEAFLLGEVWEDATTKQSHGQQRSYALGLGLDAVMNYPFRNQTLAFLMGGIDAWHYCAFLAHQRHVYPPPMYYTLMNLVSSHDVCRIRSVLAFDVDASSMTRAQQATCEPAEEEYELGGLRQRLAAAIQFSLPGIPSVYYGDETGMTGLLDPFNRKPFLERDTELTVWYQKLGELRQRNPVLCTGHVLFFSTNGNVLGILRHTVCGRDFFGKRIGPSVVLTVVNPTSEPHRIVFDFADLLSSIPHDADRDLFPENAAEIRSLLTERRVLLEKGLVEIDMPPLSVEIFGQA
ncbi:MAG: glycoside hydrolase family 13 protein [Coriobacteriia bacterium]|nr:glycoside hydrolase family 13 protein [Coriobacteriia bacterium]